MTNEPASAGPDTHTLVDLFPSFAERPRMELVASAVGVVRSELATCASLKAGLTQKVSADGAKPA